MDDSRDARQRLLDAAVDHVAAHGVGELSLRQLASALGTSHRMLIYHFGSKEGLLVEVVRAVEQRQREAFARLESAPEAVEPFGETARRFWRTLADPALWPLERLFFELYGQALQGRPGTTALLEGVVETWLVPMAESMRRHGAGEHTAVTDARLGIAVVRGLLLDLLATGDRDGVDQAMDRFIAVFAQD